MVTDAFHEARRDCKELFSLACDTSEQWNRRVLKKKDESVGMTLGLVNCMGETDVCIIGHNSENGRGDNRKRHISK